jgi:hypothetical protein
VLLFTLNGKYSNFIAFNATTAVLSPLPIKQFKALPESVQELLISARVPISTSGSVKRHVSKDAMKRAPPDTVAIRFDWGNGRGDIIHDLTFDGFGITSASLAFVTGSECRAGGISLGTFIGNAYFTIFNVAVHDSVVSVRFRVDWPSNLHICLNYFIVIDPTPYVIGS